MSELWLRCSACRKDIGYSTVHWVCSVSTCNRSRTRLVFCSVACWDSHVATLRHRDAWAVEARSPTRAQWQAEQAQIDLGGSAPRPAAGAMASTGSGSAGSAGPGAPAAPAASVEAVRRRVVEAATPAGMGASAAAASGAPSGTAVGAPSVTLSDEVEREILVVVSKLKKYIRDRSGMNCSDAVAEVLSDHLRLLCDQSIRAAAADARKTVLDRDVPRPR